MASCNSTLTEDEIFDQAGLDTIPVSNTTPNSLNAFISNENAPSCQKIPTQTEVNHGSWSYTDYFYSASQALKMGIPVVNINGSHDLKIYVKDYRRVATCTGSDSITVLYGQIIRTVIEIEHYDASVGVDLASIAANGTLKRNSQHFYFYKDGFFNPKIDSIIVTVQGKEFDVQNYALFQNVMGEVINLLRQPGTTFSPSKIGIREELGDETESLKKSPVISYALWQISGGNSFLKAKNKFSKNKFAQEIIEGTYKSLNCPLNGEKPSEESIRNAKIYLQGVKVKG